MRWARPPSRRPTHACGKRRRGQSQVPGRDDRRNRIARQTAGESLVLWAAELESRSVRQGARTRVLSRRLRNHAQTENIMGIREGLRRSTNMQL